MAQSLDLGPSYWDTTGEEPVLVLVVTTWEAHRRLRGDGCWWCGRRLLPPYAYGHLVRTLSTRGALGWRTSVCQDCRPPKESTS